MGDKGETIPVTGSGGPEGCETSRFTHFLDSSLTDGGEVVGILNAVTLNSTQSWLNGREVIRIKGDFGLIKQNIVLKGKWNLGNK